MPAFASKMPAGGLVDADGKPNPQAASYLQDMEKQTNSLNTQVSDLTATVAEKSDKLRAVFNRAETTYTFQLEDNGAYCRFTNGSAVTATIPPNSSVAFEAGTQIDLLQGGAGKLTIAAGSGVTINSVLSNKSLSAQWAGATLIQTDTIDTWDLVGSLIP